MLSDSCRCVVGRVVSSLGASVMIVTFCNLLSHFVLFGVVAPAILVYKRRRCVEESDRRMLFEGKIRYAPIIG